MSCGHVTAMRRILIGGARLCGCGNVAGALCPKLPCDRCEMRSAHSRCRVSNNLITTVLVARQDSDCRITRARRTYIHIRTQSRARARAVKTQPMSAAFQSRLLHFYKSASNGSSAHAGLTLKTGSFWDDCGRDVSVCEISWSFSHTNTRGEAIR